MNISQIRVDSYKKEQENIIFSYLFFDEVKLFLFLSAFVPLICLLR